MTWVMWGFAAAVTAAIIGKEAWRATSARIDRDIDAANASIAQHRAEAVEDCPHLFRAHGTMIACEFCGAQQTYNAPTP